MSDQADRGKDKRILILVLGVTAIVSFCCCFGVGAVALSQRSVLRRKLVSLSIERAVQDRVGFDVYIGNNLSEGRRYEPSVVDEVWCFSYTDAKSRLSYQLGMALRVNGEWEILLAHEHRGALFSADCS